jgi:hypothetical protein
MYILQYQHQARQAAVNCIPGYSTQRFYTICRFQVIPSSACMSPVAHAGTMTVVASHSFAEMMPQQQQQQQQASGQQEQQEAGSAEAADPKLHWLLVPGGVGAAHALPHALCKTCR